MSFGGRMMTQAVKTLIIVNVVVFLVQNIVGGGSATSYPTLIQYFSFIPTSPFSDCRCGAS